VKSEIPHTGHYNSLLKAVQLMGCEQSKHLHQGENAKCTSQRIIQEFLKVMADQLEQQMFCSLQSSMFSKNKHFIIGLRSHQKQPKRV